MATIAEGFGANDVTATQEASTVRPSTNERVEKIKTLFHNRPSIGEWVGDFLVTPFLSLFPSLAKKIGELVAFNLIYPTIPPKILEREIRFAQLERDLSLASPDPVTESVKRNFTLTYEGFTLDQGLKANCLTVNSNRGNTSLPTRHIVIFCGNVNSCEITRDYIPFARAWLELEKKDANLPPLKITIVSGRNIEKGGQPFIPPLSTTGQVHKEILDKLGPIDQIVGFSLGCCVAGKVMDAISEDSLDRYPKNWWLHNGPSSLEKVSKLYPLGRTVLWPAAKLTGWDANPAQSLTDFCGRIKKLNLTEKFSIGVSGLAEDTDHHFPGEAGLCNSPEVALLKTAGQVNHLLHILLSQAQFHQRDHHGRAMDSIHLKNLVDPSTGDFIFSADGENGEAFILPQEHLARSILRQLLFKN